MRSHLRPPNVSLLRRTILLLGCLLFGWSVVVPYYDYLSGSVMGSYHSILYRSFLEEVRSSDTPHTVGVIPWQRWFFDYWFGDPYQRYLGLSLLLPAIFLAQIATLTTGTISVLKPKRIVAAIPSATCLTTMILMVYQNILLSDSNLLVYTYQLGYWLTYPSLGLFIISFILRLTKET